jgi:hypothetical protein
MTGNVDRLHELLPAVHRIRDADRGYPLRGLLRIAGEQIAAIEDNIGQLYDNWFIETSEDWVVPYLAALIGYRSVVEAGLVTDGSSALAKILTPRAEAANTLAYRRRKGSLALLEQLANNAAGWPARAVEFYTLLGRAQNISHLQMQRGFTADIRNAGTLDLIDGPFDTQAHSVDVRSIASRYRTGRYNIPSVGVFVWRLKAYGLTHAPANCVEAYGPHCFSFSALGNDSPLFNRAIPETDPTGIAGELNLPVPIRRRALEVRSDERPFTNQVSEAYYGAAKSVAIYAPDWPQAGAPQPIPAERIAVADLSGWKSRPPRGRIAVDPVLGRMVFPTRHLPRNGVYVDYLYGFSADMGGGEYGRSVSQPVSHSYYAVSRDNPGEAISTSVTAALERWRDEKNALPAEPAQDDPKHQEWLEDKERLRAAVIEILDSAAYTERLTISLEDGEYLQIRAADRKRPVIRVLDHAVDRPDSFTIRGKRASRFKLDGLVVAGRGLRIEGLYDDNDNPEETGDLCDVTIRHCTLVPGWWLDCDCSPIRPHEPSIALSDSSARLVIEHSIIGAIHVTADERRHDPVQISISNSIVDATAKARPAICAPNLPLAFATVSIQNSTVVGTVETHAITLAENSIFTSEVRVGRRQTGCMRYCHVPWGSRTPRRHCCQPDEVRHAAAAGLEQEESLRVMPRFNSLRYGTPSYGQLAQSCATEIRKGADDESEMGAFHNLFQPQRTAILQARLSEYTPADMNAGILFAS